MKITAVKVFSISMFFGVILLICPCAQGITTPKKEIAPYKFEQGIGLNPLYALAYEQFKEQLDHVDKFWVRFSSYLLHYGASTRFVLHGFVCSYNCQSPLRYKQESLSPPKKVETSSELSKALKSNLN